MGPDAVQRYPHEHIPLSSAMETKIRAAPVLVGSLDADYVSLVVANQG